MKTYNTRNECVARLDEIASEIVTTKGWWDQWPLGMVITGGHAVDGAGGLWIVNDFGEATGWEGAEDNGRLPDLSHPATIGVLLDAIHRSGMCDAPNCEKNDGNVSVWRSHVWDYTGKSEDLKIEIEAWTMDIGDAIEWKVAVAETALALFKHRGFDGADNLNEYA